MSEVSTHVETRQSKENHNDSWQQTFSCTNNKTRDVAYTAMMNPYTTPQVLGLNVRAGEAHNASEAPSVLSNKRPFMMQETEEMIVPSVALPASVFNTNTINNTNIDMPQPCKKRRITKEGKKKSSRVSWNDKDNVVHLQEDPSKAFDDYKETDVWYTRNDYQNFLLDRIHTIERLRGDFDKKSDSSKSENGGHIDASPSNGTSKTDSTPEVKYCMRGLEPFQNRSTHEDMHSKRKIHKSTIIIEQVRQAMLGIKDPERFRFLVAPQSDMALYRAQELAAMDEKEVYPRKSANHQRRSSMSAVPVIHVSANGDQQSAPFIHQSHHRQYSQDFISHMNPTNATPCERSVGLASSMSLSHFHRTSSSNSSNMMGGHNQSFPFTVTTNSSPSLFSSRIRELQERNARRLMEIYKHPGSTHSSSSSVNNLFRFSLRRDSLLGSTIDRKNATAVMTGSRSATAAESKSDRTTQDTQGQHVDVMKMMPMATRFHIRRDSLNHLVTSASHR